MRWGLIGASTIAAEHVIVALRAAGQAVAALHSGSAGRARDYAAAHGIPVVQDRLADLLADPGIGAVYISSTNEKHRDQALAALAAGKHVLCEKPLAMTVTEAVAMVRAAEAAGLVFATNHHLRCSGSHRAVRALIASGRISSVPSATGTGPKGARPPATGIRLTSPMNPVVKSVFGCR